MEKLYAQLRAEKVFYAVLVSEIACIGDNILRDAYGDAFNRNYESEILIFDKRKAQSMSVEEIISALVVKDIRKIRCKTVVKCLK